MLLETLGNNPYENESGFVDRFWLDSKNMQNNSMK